MSLNVVFAITGVAVGVALVIVALVRSNKTGASVTAPSGGEKEKSFEYLGSKLVWNSLLAAVGITLVILGYYNPQIRPMDVGNVSWKYWHVVLTVWGIIALLIWLNAEKAAAKTLQTVSAGVVVAVLVAFPLWGLATSPAAPAHATAGSQQETMTLTMPANGDSARVNTRPGYAISYDGSGFSVHCIYRDGSEGIVGDEENPCRNGPMQYQYVRDTTGKTNTVTYGFVRP